jgi:hypothetical protein
LYRAFKSVFREDILQLVSEQILCFVGNGYVTIWYQSFRFNIKPVWAKDQCEFGKFIVVEFSSMTDLEKFVEPEWNPQIFEQIQVEFALIMVEEMINGIDLQVAELNSAWKVEFFVFMATEELVKSMAQIALDLAINGEIHFWIGQNFQVQQRKLSKKIIKFLKN